MSRVGKKPIPIPEGVQVEIEGQKVRVKGQKGEILKEIPPEVRVEIKQGEILVLPKSETKKVKALWGLTRALLFNLIKGVTEGYEKKLEIEGLGFKAQLEGQDLVLFVGFTHPLRIKALPGIKFSIDKNVISVSGIDKELVGQVAAQIRRLKPPEPYKGKGIRYVNEIIRRKVGKKAVTGK